GSSSRSAGTASATRLRGRDRRAGESLRGRRHEFDRADAAGHNHLQQFVGIVRLFGIVPIAVSDGSDLHSIEVRVHPGGEQTSGGNRGRGDRQLAEITSVEFHEIFLCSSGFRIAGYPEGKNPATRMRRRVSLLDRSSELKAS